MSAARSLLARFDQAEYRLCRRLNRGTEWRILLHAMRVASRLGDGVIWYALMGALPLLYGAAGLRTSLIMMLTGAAGLLFYKSLKHWLVRERPFIRHTGITLAMPPLDRYSFPSGHTLHAVSFTGQVMVLAPETGWVLLPLTAAIALSRVVLGLHYPSDVLAGALIGALLGGCGVALT